MNSKDAIEILRWNRPSSKDERECGTELKELCEAIDFAINIIRLHTPQKPTTEFDDIPYFCPNCTKILEEYEEVCGNCSQIIDWY